jgi:hypothetical protein
MGVVATVAVHQVLLWLGRRRAGLHPWVVAWCANTLLVLLSHYLQTVAESPDWGGVGARLAWTSSLLLIVVMVGLSHAVAGDPVPRTLLAGVAAADLALLAFVWLGEGLVRPRSPSPTRASTRRARRGSSACTP